MLPEISATPSGYSYIQQISLVQGENGAGLPPASVINPAQSLAVKSRTPKKEAAANAALAAVSLAGGQLSRDIPFPEMYQVEPPEFSQEKPFCNRNGP